VEIRSLKGEIASTSFKFTKDSQMRSNSLSSTDPLSLISLVLLALAVSVNEDFLGLILDYSLLSLGVIKLGMNSFYEAISLKSSSVSVSSSSSKYKLQPDERQISFILLKIGFLFFFMMY